MRYSSFIATSAFAASALAAYVPSDPWTVLTPTASAPSGAITDHDVDFGIQIVTIASHVSSKAKRDVVNQIGDGQIQKQTSETLTKPKTTTAPQVINQIGDGQIQHQTTAQVINQIGDGQIQHQTTAEVINQIGDGQIQHQTSAAKVINQISDGQVQDHPTATVDGVSQIEDGQIQKPTGKPSASEINDGQLQGKGDTPSAAEVSKDKFSVACSTSNSLKMRLKGGILSDSHDRIGAIVANRQFQFDGPPQAGTIYAAGWSITDDGFLALGDKTEFYQCLSGDFYNLYDESIGGQCAGVKFSIVDLVSC